METTVKITKNIFNYINYLFLIIILSTAVPAGSTEKALPAGESDLKQLQPVIVNRNILMPYGDLPVDYNQPLESRYKEGEVLVKFKKGINRVSAQSTASALGMSVAKEFKVLSQRRGQTYAIVKSGKLTAQEMLEKLIADPSVEAASLNYEERISATPIDTFFNSLWGLNNTGQSVGGYGAGTPDADIEAPEAWDITTGSSDVVVADIDTGVNYTHEDLAANMWQNPGEIPDNGIDDDGNGYVDDVYGIDTVNGDTDPMDDHGHGTHTAGTMAAVSNNNKGVTGVCWQAKIMALKFLSAGGSGEDSDAITCIEYVIDEKINHGVNVAAINASWGGSDYNDILKDAIEEAGNAGILFCASAGNDGVDNDSELHYPSSYDSPNIIAVAASDFNDNLASFSNYGATSVDLAAPGRYILSTYASCSIDNIFFDDMESGAGNWTTGGTNNTWAISNESSYSPTNAWSDSPGGSYANNTDSFLELNHNIDLSSATEPLKLAFYATTELDYNVDFLYIDISADGGSNWSRYFITGSYPSWTHFYLTLPSEFKTASFRFRFSLVTDDSVVYNGVHIDNVGIGDCPAIPDMYAFLSGTSMATPHVTGAVALAADRYPGDSIQARKDRILNSVDLKPAFSGKMLTGGRLNLYNLLTQATTPKTNDFDGDGNSDLLWRNTSSGLNLIWQMDGTEPTGVTWWLPTVPTDWTIQSTADFDGDGKPDLLWRNTSSGQNLIWQLDGTGPTGAVWWLPTVPTDWTIQSTADFDNDGKSDLLWRNTISGLNLIWQMNGTEPTGTTWWLPTVDTYWQIQGTADFDGDGKPDLLWRRNDNGYNLFWQMDGTEPTGTTWWLTTVDPPWSIQSTADFDNDGKSDLLWRNTSSGQNIIWQMDSYTPTGTTWWLPTVDTSWTIANN